MSTPKPCPKCGATMMPNVQAGIYECVGTTPVNHFHQYEGWKPCGGTEPMAPDVEMQLRGAPMLPGMEV